MVFRRFVLQTITLSLLYTSMMADTQASCQPDQTLTQISGQHYCVSNHNGTCYTTITYNAAGLPQQSEDAACSPCGIYPTSKCCESGQTLTKISGKYFCVNNQNGTCYSTVTNNSSGPQQSKDATCSTCGIYPASKC